MKLLYIVALAALLIPNIARGETEVLIFTANWCSHCHELENEFLSQPEQRKLLNSYDMAFKVDVDKYKSYSRSFNINSIPRVLIVEVKDGKTVRVIDSWEPSSPRDRLKTILQKFIPKKRLTFLRNMIE